MRWIVLFFFLATVLKPSFGQTKTDTAATEGDIVEKTLPYFEHKNEVSFGYLNVNELDNKVFGLPSLSYQRMFKHILAKAQFAYFKQDKGAPNSTFTRDFRSIYTFRLGAYYHIFKNSFQPFIGLETFLGASDRYKTSSYSWFEEIRETVGISGVLGSRYWLNKRFSCHLNLRMDVRQQTIYTFYRVVDDMSDDFSNPDYFTTDEFVRIRKPHFSPIGTFGFGFHF